MIEDLQRRAVAVFGNRYGGNYAALARKTAIEARELADNPDDLTEAADTLLCLLVYLDARSLTWQDLVEAAHAKMDVNEGHQWLQLDDGTWRHIG